MKKIIVTTIASVLLVSCTNVKNQKNDWTKMKIVGKVKLFRESYFGAKQEFGEVHKGDLQNVIQYVFNSSGNLIETDLYKKDGSLMVKMIYKYDDKGNVIEGNNATEGNMYWKDGRLFFCSKKIYKYNEKGKLIEENSYDAKGSLSDTTAFKYDSKGNLIEDNQFAKSVWNNTEGLHLNRKTLYLYDDKGNLIEVKWNQENGFSNGQWKYDSSKISYNYDTRGNLIEESNNGTNIDGRSGTDFPMITYKYNDNGNLIEKKYFEKPPGTSFVMVSFTYEYDKNRNWIKKHEIGSRKDWDGNSIIERVIEYF